LRDLLPNEVVLPIDIGNRNTSKFGQGYLDHGRAPCSSRRERNQSLSHRRLRAGPRPVMIQQLTQTGLVEHLVNRINHSPAKMATSGYF